MLSDAQRAAHRFLRMRAQDGEAFSFGDLERVAGWTNKSFTTYKTKHLKDYIETIGRGKYVIKPHFLRLTEEQFYEIVTQSRTPVARFVRTVFDAVLKYEFLLPLTNERRLRAALDELFYRDHLRQRAVEIGRDTLESILAAEPGEPDDDYFARVVTKVGTLLGGYSIGHVHGRFRAGGLKTYAEAATVLEQRGRYLVDETTAAVRFLLPLEASRTSHGKQFDVTKLASVDAASFSAEVDTARQLFIVFFVESVILDIHGEDEIWFLETSPLGERLYVLEQDTSPPKRSRKGRKPSRQLDLGLMSPLEAWLRESGYSDEADQMKAIIDGWKKQGLKTRRNWWDILAGDKKGKRREVAGVKFPIIAAIRKRQGLPPTEDAVSKPKEKPPPPKG